MGERIPLHKMFGLPKPTEKLRSEFFKDERKKRKKQPEAWTKTKYRRQGLLREMSIKNKKKKKFKKEFIEEEKADKWQTNIPEAD